MKKLPNTLQSTVKIRFQDCDPFNHLNNAAYLNYFVKKFNFFEKCQNVYVWWLLPPYVFTFDGRRSQRCEG